jgi:hypothetical protein
MAQQTEQWVVRGTDEGHRAPRLRCGECGRFITSLDQAGVVFPPITALKDTDVAAVTVLCKGRKRPGCLSRAAYRDLPWQELSQYLLALLSNTGVSSERKLLEQWRLARREPQLDEGRAARSSRGGALRAGGGIR